MQNKKLRKCLKEIEATMKKYRTGGYIILADQEGGEYKYVNPEWSVLKAHKQTGGFKQEVDIDHDRKMWFKHRVANRKFSDVTVHLLQVIQQASARSFLFAEEMIKMVDSSLKIEGNPIDIPPPE